MIIEYYYVKSVLTHILIDLTSWFVLSCCYLGVVKGMNAIDNTSDIKRYDNQYCVITTHMIIALIIHHSFCIKSLAKK